MRKNSSAPVPSMGAKRISPMRMRSDFRIPVMTLPTELSAKARYRVSMRSVAVK